MNGDEPGGNGDVLMRRSEWMARFISQVGFPIVVTAFLLYRFDVTIQNLAERLQQVSQAIVILTSEQRSTNDLLRERIVQSQEENAYNKREETRQREGK